METAKISSNGKITIPKSVRKYLKLNEGDSIAFVEDNNNIIITKASLVALSNLQNYIKEDMYRNNISEKDIIEEMQMVREEKWLEYKK